MEDTVEAFLAIFVILGLLGGTFVIIALFGTDKKITSQDENKIIKENSVPQLNLREAFQTSLKAHQQNTADIELQKKFEKSAQNYSDFVLNMSKLAPNNFIGSFIKPSRDVYDEILSLLVAYPTNATLHKMALDFGRMIYSLNRKNKVLSIYDENAIANDIRAAVGAATTVTPSSAPTIFSPNTTPANRLKALTDLRDAGVISEEEYVAQRKAIVESI